MTSNNSQTTRRKMIALTGTAVSIGLAGCGAEESDEFEEGDGGNGGGSSNDIELLNHEMVREESEFTTELKVQGEAENVSGDTLDYAEVEVKFLADGNVEESSLDNVNGLSPGDTWAFEVMYLGTNEESITDYEIRAGTSL